MRWQVNINVVLKAKGHNVWIGLIWLEVLVQIVKAFGSRKVRACLE